VCVCARARMCLCLCMFACVCACVALTVGVWFGMQGSVSGSVSATPSTSQPGTPPRAEGRGGSPHVTPTKQSGVKFQGQKSPSGSQPSPQAVVANNRARRLWSRGRHGAEGAAEGGAGIAIYAPPVRVWSDTVDEDGEAGVAQEMDEVAVKAEVDVGLRDVRDFNDKVKSIWESRHAGRELLQVGGPAAMPSPPSTPRFPPTVP
jgi:hypothetical protein